MRILRYRQLFTCCRKVLNVFLDFNLPYFRKGAAQISYVLADLSKFGLYSLTLGSCFQISSMQS